MAVEAAHNHLSVRVNDRREIGTDALGQVLQNVHSPGGLVDAISAAGCERSAASGAIVALSGSVPVMATWKVWSEQGRALRCGCRASQSC